jgi:hypothetical protein
LEARVEILSGGKDEALGEMRNILKGKFFCLLSFKYPSLIYTDLMTENHNLRGLIRSLAGFIGDGVGGILPKLGWDVADFNTFINKSETDTAWESFQRRKKSNASGEASSSSSQLQGQKRSMEDEPTSSRKKSRSDEPERNQTNGYPLLMSMNHPMSATYSPTTRPQDRNGVFSELIRGPNASPLYMHQSPPTSTSSPYNRIPNSEPYQPSYISNVNMTMESPLSSAPFDSSSSRSDPAQQQRIASTTSNGSDEPEIDDDPNKNEAYKLIQWVLQITSENMFPIYSAQVSPGQL